jgi:CNT family concentrative nucleoside transporter
MNAPPASVRVLWTAAAILLVVGIGSAAARPVDRASTLAWAEADSAANGEPGTGSGIAVPVEREDAAAPPAAGSPVFSAEPQTPAAALQRLPPADTPISARLRGLLGVVVILGLAWAMSVNRAAVPWRILIWGLALQVVFALFILKTPVGLAVFDGANRIVVALLGFTEEGARFIFGDLVFNNVPVGRGEPGNAPVEQVPGMVAQTGAFFAFNVLPTIIFFSSLMTVLYYLGIMQWVVKGVAWVMQRTMKTSGAETLSAAGNIFVGQTEAPLLIKPFVEKMTMSELMTVMTGGFATVAGGVLAAYVGLLIAYFPDIAGHLMAASVMSAPAALAIGKLMYPEDGEPETAGSLDLQLESPDVNAIDAAARGAHEGLHLALNVGAMLLAFIALVALANAIIGWMGGLVGLEDLSIELVLGWVLAPLAWLMGVPWSDAPTVASLMGVKTVLNEFFAYFQLSGMLSGGADLHPRSAIIAAYALSGFANFSSIAIQIGGIGGIAPSRRHDLSRIGLRAMIAGSLAAFMTGAIAGIFL